MNLLVSSFDDERVKSARRDKWDAKNKKVIPGHYASGDTLHIFGDSRLDETLGMDEEGRAEHAQNERLKSAKALQLPNSKGGVETFLL